MASLLEVDGLCAGYGATEVVHDLSMRIEEGTINVFGALQFDRRLQLTREEAFGLSLLGAAAGKLREFRRSSALRSATSVLTMAARRLAIPCICSSKALTLVSSPLG